MADEWLGRAINDYLTERGIKQIFLSQKTGIPKHKICSSLNGKMLFGKLNAAVSIRLKRVFQST